MFFYVSAGLKSGAGVRASVSMNVNVLPCVQTDAGSHDPQRDLTESKKEWIEINVFPVMFSVHRHERVYSYRHMVSLESSVYACVYDFIPLVFRVMFTSKEPNWTLFSCVGCQITVSIGLVQCDRLIRPALWKKRSEENNNKSSDFALIAKCYTC